MSSGIERMAAVFAAARSEERAALMPYMVAGFPDRETALEVASGYVEGGADLVEIGVPFSDPLADGPVIHAAATKALENGAGLETAFEIADRLGQGVPAVLMCYTNMILAASPDRFAARAAEHGVAGVIVPDLPFGEAPEIEHALRGQGIAPIPLVAPTTTPERCAEICAAAEGFIYLVSSVGTTGERTQVSDQVGGLVERLRGLTSLPVAVGFGIGSPEQAGEVGQLADGVIIGSRLVRVVDEAEDATAAAGGVAEFLGRSRALMRR